MEPGCTDAPDGKSYFGYLFDSFTAFLFPDFGVTLAQFTFVGEVSVTLWLLFKGVNVEQWQKRALKLA